MTAAKKSSKKGTRTARASDRAIARELVRLFRSGEPWRETIDDVTWEFPIVAEFLIGALETFAEHGTFEPCVNDAELRKALIVLQMNAKRLQTTATQAKGDVANSLRVSEKTIENAITAYRKASKRAT